MGPKSSHFLCHNAKVEQCILFLWTGFSNWKWLADERIEDMQKNIANVHIHLIPTENQITTIIDAFTRCFPSFVHANVYILNHTVIISFRWITTRAHSRSVTLNRNRYRLRLHRMQCTRKRENNVTVRGSRKMAHVQPNNVSNSTYHKPLIVHETKRNK